KLTMRGNKRRSLPDKQIAPNMSNSHMKVMMKSCNTGISAPSHSSVHSNNKTQEHYRVSQKTKRLKTIKQRNLIRGQNSNRSNQHGQQYKRGRKDVKCQDCQSSCSLNLSRKEKPVAKPFHSQKPSLITEGRLTSIRGLFSHEVRSVNIERLVKEKKHQKQEGQPTASHSPSCLIPHPTPPAVVSETSEEGISACASKDQGLMPIEQTDCIQTNLEDIVPPTIPSRDGTHNCAQIHRATPKTSRSGSPLDHKYITEAVILSSSENELFHKSLTTSIGPCNHEVIPKKKIRHDQKQTNKAAAVYVKHDFVNPKRLDTPVGSEFFKVDSPQFLNAQLDAPSPASFMFSSPTPDSKRSALGDESQHRNPVFSSKEEAVSRLASGLCHSLDSFPLQRCRPLLTECRKVLLHQLQERHGSQLQHSLRRLHSHISADGPRSSSDPTEQVWPSSEQNYLGNKQMYSIFTRKHEFDQQSETAEFQTDNGSQNHCLQEGFCENVNVGSASKRQRELTWETHSPQDFFRKLRRPCQDT
ncbi:proline-rich protein 19, partial [Clarias magur]